MRRATRLPTGRSIALYVALVCRPYRVGTNYATLGLGYRSYRDLIERATLLT